MPNIKSFPNNQDVYIGAESVMKWLHGRTSGVYGSNGNCAVYAVSGSMAVEVTDGVGWMANENGDGVVWWVDTESTTTSRLMLQIDAADGVLDRIDRVVVSWRTTDFVDLPTVSILKGSPSSTPVAPALTNDNILRQISIARISIKAGTISITPSMITDERLDPSVCGIVASGVEIDTSVMNAQFTNWFASIKDTLSEDVAGNLLNLIQGLEDSKVPITRKINGKTLDKDISLETDLSGNVVGTLAISNGGTGGKTASEARTNLGLDNTVDAVVTYYASATAMSADDLTVPTALIPVSASVNPDLYRLLAGSYAYVLTIFYSSRSTASRRTQIALPYNSTYGGMASRSYGSNGWTEWQRITTNILTSLEYGDTLPATGAKGQIFFRKVT